MCAIQRSILTRQIYSNGSRHRVELILYPAAERTIEQLSGHLQMQLRSGDPGVLQFYGIRPGRIE